MAKIVVKVAPPSGDPVKSDQGTVITPTRGKAESDLDLRDRLAELVGKGNNLSPDDKAAIYGNLSTMIGQDKARKIMTHAYIFNSRPDVQKLGLEDKLRSFYTIGSNDPEVMDVLGRTKNLAQGVVPGMRSSVSSLNQQIQSGQPTQIATVSPEIQKKVKVRLSR